LVSVTSHRRDAESAEKPRTRNQEPRTKNEEYIAPEHPWLTREGSRKDWAIAAR
jgi:hypothetical protein